MIYLFMFTFFFHSQIEIEVLDFIFDIRVWGAYILNKPRAIVVYMAVKIENLQNKNCEQRRYRNKI